jgi:hypothetical protein
MKKQLNIDQVRNELRGGSAFFPGYKSPPAPPPAEPGQPTAGASPQAQADRGLPERANARTPVRANGKRIITRNSFEIYEDQMDSLRRRAMEEKMEGRLGSMSAMVRAAIDEYLHKKTSEK